MKKGILISIISVLLVSVIFISLFNLFPKGKYHQGANCIDNGYNNYYLSEGNIVNIENKLYFNYNGKDSIFMYGLYEISDNSSKRIFWNGPSFEPGNNLYKLQKINDCLLFSNYTDDNTYSISGNEITPQFSGDIINLDLQTNDLNKLHSISINGNPCCGYYYIIDNKIYIFTDDKIYISEDGLTVVEIFSGLADVVNKTAYEKLCYISDNSLFYISNDNYLIEYDLLKKKQRHAVSLSGISNNPNNYGELFTCDEKVIITFYKGDYVSVYTVDNEADLIYIKESNDYYYINSCNNKIFVSSKSIGLDMIDIKACNTKTLVKTNVCDTYIFDDKWVYYVDTNGYLNRINHIEGISEIVFK